MDPDYLTFDANGIKAEYEAGKVAIMNEWGSLAGAMLDDEGAADGVVANTVLAAAPTIGGGTIPAAALWWDGFTIAKNISDEDAEASFQAMVHGISPEVVAANPDVATWLVKGYEPGPAAVGVIANANGGARAYPMQPYMGLLHTALRPSSPIHRRARKTPTRRWPTSRPPTTPPPRKAASSSS